MQLTAARVCGGDWFSRYVLFVLVVPEKSTVGSERCTGAPAFARSQRILRLWMRVHDGSDSLDGEVVVLSILNPLRHVYSEVYFVVGNVSHGEWSVRVDLQLLVPGPSLALVAARPTTICLECPSWWVGL